MAKFGSHLHIGFVSGDLELAAELDAAEVDSLWVGGHVASRNPSGEVMVNLARLSAVTTRARLGTSILLLPLYPPAIVAKQVADLDRATDGRLILGVGVGGEYPGEFRACQVPINERGSRTDEAIPLLRELWTAESVSHHGKHYSMDDVRVHPAPLQDGGPPVVVAGRKEPAMRRAAVLGDGWMPYLYSPRRYAMSVTTIKEAAATAGRDLSGFGWFAYIYVSVDSDGDAARRQAARMLGGLYNQDFQAMVDSVTAAGTPKEVLHKLKGFIDAGARHLILLPMVVPGAMLPEESKRDRRRLVQQLVDDLVPELRDYGARLQVDH